MLLTCIVTQHIIVFPLPHSGLINVVAFVSQYDKVGSAHPGRTVENRSKEELLALYEGWEDGVQQILNVRRSSSCRGSGLMGPLTKIVHRESVKMGHKQSQAPSHLRLLFSVF